MMESAECGDVFPGNIANNIFYTKGTLIED